MFGFGLFTEYRGFIGVSGQKIDRVVGNEFIGVALHLVTIVTAGRVALVKAMLYFVNGPGLLHEHLDFVLGVIVTG